MLEEPRPDRLVGRLPSFLALEPVEQHGVARDLVIDSPCSVRGDLVGQVPHPGLEALLQGERAQPVDDIIVRKDVAGRVAEINAMVRQRGGAEVTLRAVPHLDSLTTEAYLRRWEFKKEREAASDIIVDWLVRESADPARDILVGLLATFGWCFGEKHRATLMARLPGFRPAPDKPIEPRRARGFIYDRVGKAMNQERSKRIEAELRERRRKVVGT